MSASGPQLQHPQGICYLVSGGEQVVGHLNPVGSGVPPPLAAFPLRPPFQPRLTSAPDSPQPWFIVPWRSCCSACLLPSPCCCCGSWDLICCSPCWASWGPWPWALFVGTPCYTCCHMYVKPLSCPPAPGVDSLHGASVFPVIGHPLSHPSFSLQLPSSRAYE